MSAYGDETERSKAMLFLSTLNPVIDVLPLYVAAISKLCVRLRKRCCARCVQEEKRGTISMLAPVVILDYN